MLPFAAASGAREAQAPSAQIVPAHVSDRALADAIVHDIRAIPGVVDMGQGLSAKAATYGPKNTSRALCCIMLHRMHFRLRHMSFLRRQRVSKLSQTSLALMHLHVHRQHPCYCG